MKYKLTCIVFLIFHKSSSVYITICISNNSLSLHLIIQVISFINRTIFKNSFSTNKSPFFKSSFQSSLFFEIKILSLSLKLSIHKISFIFTSIETQNSLSCFLSFLEITYIRYFPKLPFLSSLSMFFIIYPGTIINCTLLYLNKYSISICFTFFKFSLINISTSLCKSSFPME